MSLFFAAVIASIGVLTLVAHIVGRGASRTSFWGVHFYAFFPPYVLVLATIFLVAACVIVIRRHRADPSSDSPGSGQRFAVFPSLIGGFVVWSGLLWLARSCHTFLGDGNVLTVNVAVGQMFHPRQPLTMIVQQWIYKSASGLFDDGRAADLVAADALALGSVVAGMFFFWAAWLLSRELSLLASPRLKGVAVPVFLILLTQGYVQLFFGYVENYTFYALLVTLYLALALRFLRGVAPLALPAIVCVSAIAFHLSGVILVPSLAVLAAVGFVHRDRRIGATRDLVLVVLLTFGFRYLFGRVSAGYDLFSALASESGLALTRQQDVVAGYMWSQNHFRDFLNEQLLIGPLGAWLFAPLLIAVVLMRARRHLTNIFLLIAGVFYLAASWLIGDLNLGYARDWDILSSGGLVLTVAGIGLYLRSATAARSAPLLLLCAWFISLFHTIPWIATNASASRSYERLTTLPLGMGRTEMLVGKWHVREGEILEAKTWYKKAIAANRNNNNAFYLLGELHVDLREYDAAAEAFTSASRLRPDKVLFREKLSDALYRAKRYRDAIPHLAFAVEHRPNALAHRMRYGDSLEKTDRVEEAMRVYQAGLSVCQSAWERDPEGFDTNFYYGLFLSKLQEAERAVPYFERAVHGRPNSALAHYYAGIALRVSERHAEAKTHFERCIEINPKHPDRARIKSWIDEEH